MLISNFFCITLLFIERCQLSTQFHFIGFFNTYKLSINNFLQKPEKNDFLVQLFEKNNGAVKFSIPSRSEVFGLTFPRHSNKKIVSSNL